MVCGSYVTVARMQRCAVSSALCDARRSGRILAGVRCSASVHAAPDLKLRFTTHNHSASRLRISLPFTRWRWRAYYNCAFL